MRDAIKQEIKLTKRGAADAVNTHMYYTACKTVNFTHKASLNDIRRDFQHATKLKTLKSGKFSKAKRQESAFGSAMMGKVVNKRRGAKGLRGLSGPQMEDAIRTLYNLRVRSIAFIASTFLPAVKLFERVASRVTGKPPLEKNVRQYGRKKGGGLLAKDDKWPIRAAIYSYGETKGDKKDAVARYGGQGLQMGFNSELANLKRFLERKMQEAANTVNARR